MIACHLGLLTRSLYRLKVAKLGIQVRILDWQARSRIQSLDASDSSFILLREVVEYQYQNSCKHPKAIC